MKKLLMCAFAVVIALMAGSAFAALEYGADFEANASFENEITIFKGASVDLDIYLRDLPEALSATGVWLSYDETKVEITAVGLYDSTAGEPIGGTAPAGYPTNYTGLVGNGCWDATGMSSASWQANGDIYLTMATIGVSCGSAAGDDIIAKVTFKCIGAGDATIMMEADQAGSTVKGDSGTTYDTTITDKTVTIHQEVECTSDAECYDDLWCTGLEACVDDECVDGTPPCPDDGNACSIDCEEAGTPAELTAGTCNAADTVCDEAIITGPLDACCMTEPCMPGGVDEAGICAADVTLTKEITYFNPSQGDQIVIKQRICMDNQSSSEPGAPSGLVGGVQFDLCDEPDCLECIDCELTERTTMFDCFVIELPDDDPATPLVDETGCCRVIMMCKNPGCAINPGLCDIITIVFKMKDGAPQECYDDCIDETFENIVLGDYDGFQLAGAGLPAEVCPIACGDVCPPGSGVGNDCGDGIVDIYDIMCEVDFALTATVPNACQAPRADVPTGTPPDCTAPDGSINILDIMVIIDMALNRQDCCSFYYLGIIY